MLPVLGDCPLNKISKKQLVDYHLALDKSGLAKATSNHYLKLIRFMLNLAVDWKVIEINPAARIKMLPVNNQRNPSLTSAQLDKFLSVLRKDDHQVSRLALLLISTGVRKSEALNAVAEDYDLSNNVWHINPSYAKSGRSRAVPLNASALKVLEEIMPKDMTGPLFTIKTVDKKWKKLKEEACVEFLTLHSLRHLFASYLINQGSSLYIVQKILGHSSPIVTERYAHLTGASLVDAARSVDATLMAPALKSPSPRLLPAPAKPTSEAA
jgi:integrase